MNEKCKVVYGSTATGFKDVTEPMPYEKCVEYLTRHANRIADFTDDPHYADGLDIINVETGRLMSWVFVR